MIEAHARSTFQEAGSLRTPGLVGRGVRLVFGIGALYWLFQLIAFGGVDLLSDVPLVALTAFALYLVPYVVNIGFGLGLGSWPRVIALLALAAATVIGWFTSGAWFSESLWLTVFILNAYTFTHLGMSFILSAIFATPGCEMRSAPILWGRLFDLRVRDHVCPGPIGMIDRWEAGLKRHD